MILKKFFSLYRLPQNLTHNFMPTLHSTKGEKWENVLTITLHLPISKSSKTLGFFFFIFIAAVMIENKILFLVEEWVAHCFVDWGNQVSHQCGNNCNLISTSHNFRVEHISLSTHNLSLCFVFKKPQNHYAVIIACEDRKPNRRENEKQFLIIFLLFYSFFLLFLLVCFFYSFVSFSTNIVFRAPQEQNRKKAHSELLTYSPSSCHKLERRREFFYSNMKKKLFLAVLLENWCCK